MFGGAFLSKEIETLHNVTSFSKLSYGHFSENITKFSEHLSLASFSNYIVNEHMPKSGKLPGIIIRIEKYSTVSV